MRHVLGKPTRRHALPVLLILLTWATSAAAVAQEGPTPTAMVGWHGERMPKGLRKGKAKPVYLWSAAKGVDIEMVYVPPGDFVMGADDGEPDEKPRRTQPMTSGYYLGRHEVTRAQYAAFCKAKGRQPPPTDPADGGNDQYPVAGVGWAEASAFCEWAGLALPTEAQWEKAARGADGRTYPWGSEAPSEELCGSYYELPGAFEPVGRHSRGASPFGALGMVGGVLEWCADAVEVRFRAVRGGTPTVSSTGAGLQHGLDARASARHAMDPADDSGMVGFRVARP